MKISQLSCLLSISVALVYAVPMFEGGNNNVGAAGQGTSQSPYDADDFNPEEPFGSVFAAAERAGFPSQSVDKAANGIQSGSIRPAHSSDMGSRNPELAGWTPQDIREMPRPSKRSKTSAPIIDLNDAYEDLYEAIGGENAISYLILGNPSTKRHYLVPMAWTKVKEKAHSNRDFRFMSAESDLSVQRHLVGPDLYLEAFAQAQGMTGLPEAVIVDAMTKFIS